ncbi:MAG TPA: benzoate-CoA ligase family protein [Usitatibacter sp.]|nr:benzoate-CoA ligase family protein [Usitatibacter sp.]
MVPPPEERFNFAQHLLDRNAARPRAPAYTDDHESITYGDLDERVRRMSTAVRALGVHREERVLLLMHDNNDWPVAFLGCLHAGVVPVAVNTLLTADDYAYILAHSRAQGALVSPALLATLEKAMAQAPHEVRFIHASPLRDLLAAHAPSQAAAATHREDIAFWLYSSGSTGRPKGTVHTHANPYWTAELYGKGVLGMTERDFCFSAAKLFFAYGLGNALTFPLSVGASVLLMAERPTPDAVFKRWTQKKPTIFFGAPTGYAGMLASPNLPKRGDVALRLGSSAGEALPKEIGERFTAHFGCEVIDGIGSTEMLHIFISNKPGAVCYGTTGQPVPGYDVELRGDDGKPVQDGGIGDLYVRGPSAALMYWGNREKSAETFQGGWTRSGDKYFRDPAGNYVYAGRSDDMLKVSGQFVSPFEVEATLMKHAAVLEAALIGTPDADGITRSKAFVVLKPGQAASPALETELRTFVKGELAPYKCPRSLEFIAELPKTATGKIQRFKLREREAASRPA